MNILGDYAADHDGFIIMLQPLKSVCDGHLGHVTTATHKVEFNPHTARPIHSYLFQTVPKERDSEENKIDKMVSMNIMEPARTE